MGSHKTEPIWMGRRRAASNRVVEFPGNIQRRSNLGPATSDHVADRFHFGCPPSAPRRATPKPFLKTQINKPNSNDARGIAQMMQANFFCPGHRLRL